MQPPMNCVVYKSLRRADVYLFVRSEQDGRQVPAYLRALMEPLERVMALELHFDRQLARADVREVMAQLRSEGFYVQLPPGKSRL